MKFLLLPILSMVFEAAAFSQEPVIKTIANPKPVFPAEAKDYIYGEDVKVAIKVNKKGEVSEAAAWGPLVPCSNRADPVAKAIAKAATQAAKDTTFVPATRDGKPTELLLMITYPLRSKPRPVPG